MDAKEFELPIEGSLSKTGLIQINQFEEPKVSSYENKARKKINKLKKNNSSLDVRKIN